MSQYAVMPLIDYADTCGAIRARITDQSIIKSSEMPMKITEVYVNGRDEGYNQGWDIGYRSGFDEGMSRSDVRYEEGLTEGKAEVYAQIEPINAQLENTLNGTDTGGKSYYDEFWDALQDNGNRTSYGNCFANWASKCFYPKYDVRLVGNSLSAFQNWLGDTIDLAARLEECGVVLDTSEATNLDYAFVNRVITRLPRIDTRGANSLNTTFSNATYNTIDELVLREDGSQTFISVFDWTLSLTNLIIKGTIGQNGFNVQWSQKLSKDSIISIINALSTTASGKSVTLSKVAVESAFGSTASEEWISLINTRSNWTINLV